MPVHSFKNPLKYSKNNSLQYDFAMRVLSGSKIEIDARILDLGCGDGRITKKLAELANKGCVVGADISEMMISHASRTYQNQGNLRFIQMDTSKNFFRSQFDLITSFNSLHWVKDQENAICGIANALVENGKIILLLSHKKSHYHHAIDGVCGGDKWGRYFKDYSNPRSFFELEEYEGILRRSKLKVISLAEREMIYRFDSIVELKEFFSSSMANVKRIPSDLEDEFLSEYCEILFKLMNGKDANNIPLSFWCLEVIATR